MTAFEEIHELDLSLSDTSLLAEESTRYLRTLIDHLNERQSRPDEVILRGFQRDIVRNGFFEVPSPFSGKQVASGDAVVLPDRVTFYRFPDEPGLLLGAANLGKGYPVPGYSSDCQPRARSAWGTGVGHHEAPRRGSGSHTSLARNGRPEVQLRSAASSPATLTSLIMCGTIWVHSERWPGCAEASLQSQFSPRSSRWDLLGR